jgi:hypothetical protein
MSKLETPIAQGYFGLKLLPFRAMFLVGPPMLVTFGPESLTEFPLIIGPCCRGLAKLCPRRTPGVGVLLAGTELTLAVSFGSKPDFGLES